MRRFIVTYLLATLTLTSLNANEVYPGVSAAATLRGLWLPPCEHAVGYTYESPYHERADLDICLSDLELLSTEMLLAEAAEMAANLEQEERQIGIDFTLVQEAEQHVELTKAEEEAISSAFTSFNLIYNENADDMFLTDLEEEMISQAFKNDKSDLNQVESASILTPELIMEITEELVFGDD